MLTVEVGLLEDGNFSEVVEMYFDREGLDYLIARLLQIQEEKTDHINLMSNSWGLGDLDEVKQRERNLLAHHLRATLVEKIELNNSPK
jgi:hypothetical protein